MGANNPVLRNLTSSGRDSQYGHFSQVRISGRQGSNNLSREVGLT
jgi:hypothetical protein